ncbi:hypothetical protein [Corallococcus carmarthensis]|uniref:Uncharacterized protein n=1 Tax=Corallococcus carmarthensis TaxID=2316728 RepID=A0A3A8KJ62_9BACT|nr:hypothetical protein [Corallococcus carmarthensis]NOK17194.1 hypothetical protein [Corallococcus carmarthensis]RKH01954.1 hypothetical protein D7X32_18355 [Corallococcus carmarthensis]
MIHSDEKVRQMARSLLPSKNREAARAARRHIHRSARKEARQELATWMRFGDMEHDLPPFAPWERPEIRLEVRWRRGGDKVNPFIRWATARTREVRREDRLSHVRRLLPQGVIGEHALGHVEYAKAFRDPVLDAWRPLQWVRWEMNRKGHRMDRGELAQLLRALLMEPDGHRTFNRFLRERRAWASSPRNPESWSRGLPPHRPLLGAHDILPFLDTLKLDARGNNVRAREQQEPPTQWVQLFLRRFKDHRGHIPSVRAALEAEGLMEPVVTARPRQVHGR